MNTILHWFDKAAGWWIDWRSHERVKNDPDYKDIRLINASVDKTGRISAGFIAPGVIYMADEAAEMLTAHSVENYLAINFMPRVDRNLPEVEVVVRWANKNTPHQMRMKFENELKALKQTHELTIDALEMIISAVSNANNQTYAIPQARRKLKQAGLDQFADALISGEAASLLDLQDIMDSELAQEDGWDNDEH